MAKRPTSKTPGKTTTRKTAATRSAETATKPASRSRKTVRTTSAPMQARAKPAAAPAVEAIAARAYELFEARGFAHGHDLEDWLRAEQELRARG